MLTDEEKALLEHARSRGYMASVAVETREGLLAIIDRITQEPAILDAAEGILRDLEIDLVVLRQEGDLAHGTVRIEQPAFDKPLSIREADSLSEAVAKLKGGG